MGRRFLLLVAVAAGAIVVTGVADAAAGRAAAKQPSVPAMVLAKEDFSGALVAYQGRKIAPVFAPVIRRITISAMYSRTLTNAGFQALRIPQIFSTAFLVPSESQLAELVQNLTIATEPGPGRRAFVTGMQGAAGPGESATLVRARTLRVGDAAIELVLHLKLPSGEFDLAEVWVRLDKAVSAAATLTFRPLTPGQSFALAKVVAAHMKRAVASAS